MAIQTRRGLKKDFDVNKLLPGELATPLDTKELYAAFAPGDVKRIATYEDMVSNIEQVTEDIRAEYLEDIETATANANTSGQLAGENAIKAEQATQQAQSIVQSAAPIINTNLQATYSDKATGLTGTSIQSAIADDGLVEIVKIEGATTVTKSNPDLDISPDNVATITNAKNFDVVAIGKNLLPNLYNYNTKTGTYTASGANISYTKNQDGSIIISGINGTSVSTNIWYAGGYYPNYSVGNTLFNLPPGTYTLKDVKLFGHLDRQGELTSIPVGIFTITKELSVNGIRNIDEAINTTINKEYYPQLEFGSIATTYEPYKSNKITIPYELAKLPNGVCDTIEDLGGGKGKLTQRIGKAVFDGSYDESYTKSSVSDNNYCVFQLNVNYSLDVLCDSFKILPFNGLVAQTSENVRVNTSGNYPRFSIATSRLTTLDVAGFRSWLSNNPIIFQYELATPIETIIDLPQLTSYKGITNIYTTANPQVNMIANFKSELWSDRYLKTKALADTKDSKVSFVEATTDSDIASNDTHATLFGKILKRFNTIAMSLTSKIDKTSIVQTTEVNDTTKVPSSAVTYAHGQAISTLNSNLAVKADESNTHTYKVTTATALKDIAESGFYRIDAPGLFTDYPSALSTTPYGIVEVSVCALYKSYCITATDASVTVSKTIHGFSNAGSAIIWGTAM